MTTVTEVEDIRAEWLDRYGPLPAAGRGAPRRRPPAGRVRRTGVREVTVAKNIARLSPLELKTSQRIRLQRLYPKAIFKEDTGQLVLPFAATATRRPRRRARRPSSRTSCRMSRTNLSLLVKRLFVLLVAVGLTVTAACGAVSPYAAIVNGDHLTQKDLDRELKAIKGNKTFVDALKGQGLEVEGASKDTFDMAFVSRVLTRRIFFALVGQEVAKRKLKVSADDLDKAREEAITSLGGADTAKDFPKAYLDDVTKTTADSRHSRTSWARGSSPTPRSRPSTTRTRRSSRRPA